MAGKPLKKSSLPGVSIRQLVEEIPEGCSTPDFQQKPVTLALQEGKNAIFRAVVCGEPRPEVHWQSTKGDLSNCSKYQVSSVPGGREHVLQINKLTGEDTDLYRCVAVNMYGEAVCSARLTVIEVGFRKNRKRQKEPPEDLRKELMDFRKMLKKRAPPPVPEEKMETEQVWQLLMTADRKDYEKLCMKYGIVDFRGMLRKLQEMKKEREDKMAQYVNTISNLRHIRVTKEGVATFHLELDLKDLESKIYLYKDGEMIPYGFDNQTKHCLRRLGKRYHFQIQDLRPEDAGLYQVKVEDAVVFSTELEAGAIPPRVVVPLCEARCEEQGDAVFECTLSNPCPSATWHFQHRPLRLSDKYEVSVSPDGLTHRLVVKGARSSDKGLYSLGTGLHASSAWLVVEGKDKGLQTTSADHQLQMRGAQAPDAEDTGGVGGRGGKFGEQGPMGGSLEGTEPDSGLQLTVGPDRGGLGRHGYSLMGHEEADDPAWGPGQETKGFLEAEGSRVTLPGDDQPYLEGDRGGSLPGKSPLQGEGPESRSGFMERSQGHGRDGDGGSWGTVGGWDTGSSHPQTGGLGSSRGGKEPRKVNSCQLDIHGQELWETHLGTETEKRALAGTLSDPEGSCLNREGVVKTLRGDYPDEMQEGACLRGERGGGARAGWASGTPLGGAGDSNGAGGLGTSAFPGGRRAGFKADMDPGSWGSQESEDADLGEARSFWEPGEHLGQTSGGKPFPKSSLSGDKTLVLGGRSPEAKAEGFLQEADDREPGKSGAGRRGYEPGSGGPRDPRDWESGLQGLQGRGGQFRAGALGRTGDGSRSLQSPQGWTEGQRGAGGPIRTEAEGTGPWDNTQSSFKETGSHLGPGALGSGEREGGMLGALAAGLVDSGQGVDVRSHRLLLSPGLGAQRSQGTLGDTEGLRDPVAIGPEPDFWNESGTAREKEPRGEMGCKYGRGGWGREESRYGGGSGFSKGTGPRNRASYNDGSRVSGDVESELGAGSQVSSGSPMGTESEQGRMGRHGSERGMWSRNKDGSPVGERSGRGASLRDGSHGPDGLSMDEAQNWGASQGKGQTGSGERRCSEGGFGSPGTVGPVGRGGLKGSGIVETVREGHMEAEPGGSGPIRPWHQPGDDGDFAGSGIRGALGEGGYDDGPGGPGAIEPGSLKAGGKEGDGDRARCLSRTGHWDDTRHPEALAPHSGASAGSPWAHGSGDVLGYGSNIPEPQETGGRIAYGEGSGGLGAGRAGPEGEAGFRDGSGGLGGMGTANDAGYRNGAGGSGLGLRGDAGYRGGTGSSEDMGLRGDAGYRDSIGGSGDVGPRGEAGYRGTAGGSRDMGPGGEGYKDGTGGFSDIRLEGEAGCRGAVGGSRDMGSRGEKGYRGGIRGSGDKGPGGEAGYRGTTGGSRNMGSRGTGYKGDTGGSRDMGSGGGTVYKDGAGGSRDMGLEGEADYKDDFGGSGDMVSRGEAGYRGGFGGSGSMKSRGKEGHRDVLGNSGISSGSEAGYRGGLECSRDILSQNDGLGGTGSMESGSKVDYRGGSGGFGEMGPESEMCQGDGSGEFGVPGSLSGMRHKAGPGDHKATGHGAGYGIASEGGTSSKDGPGKDRRMGPAHGVDPGVGSGMAGTQSTAAGMAHRDGPAGQGMLGTEGKPQSLSNGRGSKSSLGGYGPSGTPEALAAVGSQGKPCFREWQDGSGIPGPPRDPSGREGRSADQEGGLKNSGFLDGRGAVGGGSWARTAALESGHERDSWKAGSGTTGRGRVAGQGGPVPQGGEDPLRGGRRRGTVSCSSAGAGQNVDSSSVPQGRGQLTSGGQGVDDAWAPGWAGQGFCQGSIGAGDQLSGSTAPRSLQEEDAAFRGTHEGPGGSRGREHAPGQEASSGCQGPGALESKGLGSGRGGSGGAEDSGGPGKGASTEWKDGFPPKPRESGLRGTWNNSDGSICSKGFGSGLGGIQGPSFQLGKGQGGGRRSLGEQGFLEAENGKVQGPGALNEYERWEAEESGRSGRKPGPHRSRCQGHSGVEVDATKKRGAKEARDKGWPPGREDRRYPGGTQSEDESQGPPRHLVSRKGAEDGRLDICGEGRDATQSPRSRYKSSSGSFSTEAPGYFCQGLADMEVQPGEAAVLSCTLTSDLGPGAWFKDGVKLTAQDGVIFEQDGLTHRLLIAHVQGTQAGRYTFVVGNQQSEAALTIQDPPVIASDVTEKLKEPVVVKAGRPVTVKIPFQSHLPVQAAWRKDGADVAGSSCGGAQVALGDGYTRLCLPSAGRNDSGQYSVMLRSDGGSVRAELTLQVIDKPQPPQGPLEVQDCRGAGVRLHWRPPRDDGGRAVEHYVLERRQAGRSTWLKVGEPAPDSTTFADTGVERGRKYAFRVRAVTSEGAGEALESEEVLVAPEALPGPPSTPAIVSASSQAITLTWMAPRGPGSAHILGYLIEKRRKGSSAWTAVNGQPVSERRCVVTDLRQGCQYEFRVTAMAPSGLGEPGPPSEAVFARDPMRPPGPVRDLQVTDTTHSSITLSWTGPDTQDGDDAQGYVVELCGSDSLQWSPCHVGTVPGTTFTAKGLRPREGYLVRVTAVNDGGRSQPTALDALVHAMPVTVCPKFLMDSNKDSLTVRAGDTLRVPVSFEATPMPEVTWLKDGLPLPIRSVTTTKDGLTQLLIPAASLSDSGRYTVVLRDLQGKEATYHFLIRVAARPRAPGPVRLQQSVPGSVTVRWEPSPDEALGVHLHYAVLTRSSSHGPWREVADRIHTDHFTLLGVLPGHEYHFRVVAKNELGTSQPSDTSQPWCLPRQRDRFTVRAPSVREPDLSQKPRFLVALRAHLLPRGCECRMTCAVRGSPRPRVTWLKNGQSLEGDPAVYSTDTLGVCSLVIPSVSPADGGEYQAVAENALGQAVSTATLIVTEPDP